MIQRNFPFPSFSLIVLFLFCFIHAKAEVPEASEIPVIFSYNESAVPGEAVGIQGHMFGAEPEIWYAIVNGPEKELKPHAQLNIISHSDIYIATILPDEKIMPAGKLIAIWVKSNQQFSKPVFINRARIMSVEFEEIMPNYIFRVFGRNLFFPGPKPELTFFDPVKKLSFPAEILQSDPYILQVKAPGNIVPGVRYSLIVNNGAGGGWGETLAEETLMARNNAPDPFSIGTPWGADFIFYKNVYNIKTDQRLSLKAKGDSISNDRDAIQQAIDRASKDGGGVVFLPKGKYKLDFTSGSGLTMRSNVVLQGDGPDASFILFGFGVPPPYPDPIGKGGWPDETVDGVAMLWPLGTKLSGLSEICIQNVNTTGLWRHSLKTMPPKEKAPGGAGSGFFAVNCKFDLSIAWGLSWSFIDNMVITGCDFNSYAQITWPWLWHCDGSTNFVVSDNRVRYAAGRFGFSESYNGIIENNHITRYGDLQTFKGETGGFNIDYAKDIIVMKNRMDVDGAPIVDRNMGETILSQGGNPVGQTLGKVTGATATSLSDADQKLPKFGTHETNERGDVNPSIPSFSNSVAIVKGKGAGQWRYITSNTTNTMQIDRPWDIIPEKGSRYVVMKWSAEDWLVKDNILQGNNRGIWFYCGGHDVIIEGNQLYDSEGIYLRADQRMEVGRYNLIWNFLVENNKVYRFEGKRPAYICSVLAIQPGHLLTGTGTMGVGIRRNIVQALNPNVKSFVPGEGYRNEVRSRTPEALDNTIGILGTLFENNKAVNCDYGYQLSDHISQTIIKDPVFVNVSANTNESEFAGASAIGTVLLTEKPISISDNDPFAPYLTGSPPKILKDLGEEIENGVRIRKLIFHSYNYMGDSGQEEAQIFGAIVRPEKQGKYPGMLVLHGGGGFAEIEKAKKWAALGYVVVVVDEPGVASPEKIPLSHGPWEKFKYGENRFTIKPEITSSTLFSAVLASVQGLYLLYDQPDVIKEKIGISGISWGGYLTTIVSGLANNMIAASFSVFGSGFYDDGSTFLKNLNTMDPNDRAIWLKYLDAGRRASSIKTPFFIAAAANDNWFYPPAVTSTLRNIKGPVNHLFSPNNSHKIDLPGGTVGAKPGQPGWLTMEQTYFDYHLKGIGQALPIIQELTTEKLASGNMLVKFKVSSVLPVESGQVCLSPVGVEWTKRKWEIVQAVKSSDGWFEAELAVKDLNQPFECYATISDARPVTVSSYMVWCK